VKVLETLVFYEIYMFTNYEAGQKGQCEMTMWTHAMRVRHLTILERDTFLIHDLSPGL